MTPFSTLVLPWSRPRPAAVGEGRKNTFAWGNHRQARHGWTDTDRAGTRAAHQQSTKTRRFDTRGWCFPSRLVGPVSHNYKKKLEIRGNTSARPGWAMKRFSVTRGATAPFLSTPLVQNRIRMAGRPLRRNNCNIMCTLRQARDAADVVADYRRNIRTRIEDRSLPGGPAAPRADPRGSLSKIPRHVVVAELSGESLLPSDRLTTDSSSTSSWTNLKCDAM